MPGVRRMGHWVLHLVLWGWQGTKPSRQPPPARSGLWHRIPAPEPRRSPWDHPSSLLAGTAAGELCTPQHILRGARAAYSAFVFAGIAGKEGM